MEFEMRRASPLTRHSRQRPAPDADQGGPMARGPSPLEENPDREEIDQRWRDALSRYFAILQEWSRNDRQNRGGFR